MYAEYKSLEDILVSANDPKSVPDVTILRCAITDLETNKRPCTAAAIFELLEEKMPWSGTEEATEISVSIVQIRQTTAIHLFRV